MAIHAKWILTTNALRFHLCRHAPSPGHPGYPLQVIDLHSHILPGLDDGARDIEDSIAIARSMVEDGVTIVAATPPVRVDYPTTARAAAEALALVRAAVADAGIEIDIRGGGEIALDHVDSLGIEGVAAFGLGGNPKLVLVEYPYYDVPLALARTCARLRLHGVVPVIAHPERNQIVQRQPNHLEEVVSAGGLVQLTAASVDGRLGRNAADCARRLLDSCLAHLIASDAHSPGLREAGLSAAADTLNDPELARWLTVDVPSALLADAELPPRPPARKRQAGVLRRFGRST